MTREMATSCFKKRRLTLTEPREAFLQAYEQKINLYPQLVISTNKLITSILLLSQLAPETKAAHLFSIYADNPTFIRGSGLKGMIDHLFFCVEEALPSLIPQSHSRYGRILSLKIEMKRKVSLLPKSSQPS